MEFAAPLNNVEPASNNLFIELSITGIVFDVINIKSNINVA
jgi:hypothetical protein